MSEPKYAQCGIIKGGFMIHGHIDKEFIKPIDKLTPEIITAIEQAVTQSRKDIRITYGKDGIQVYEQDVKRIKPQP